MTSAISKRQQARNEKQIQELVHTVTGNNVCADCYARNPAWASWSLGVFLCMRCAAIHRKLGTHISKVKSLSMDSWTNEQVANMRKVGNLASNRIYNPQNKRPPVPIDVEEADSAMERFIRQKYVHNTAVQTKTPHSPVSDEGIPPPLPPKNSKFGFRAAFSRSKNVLDKPAYTFAPDSPPLTNKPSKVFGATLDYDAPDDTERKLVRLQDMGFQNSQRNAIVLKGVSGSLERAVESLVRLGEGDRPPPAPPKEKTLRATKSLTPMMPSPNSSLNVVQRSETDRPTTSSTTSTNPFDVLNRAQPQTAHSTGSLRSNNPYNASTSPLTSMSTQASPVDQAFQNLTLCGQKTGASADRWGASLTIPQLSQANQRTAPTSPLIAPGMNLPNSMAIPFAGQQQQTSVQPQVTGYNPYMSQSTYPIHQQQQQYTYQNGMSMSINQMDGQVASNPFTRSPTQMASPPPLGQILETSTLGSPPLPLASSCMNPFFGAQHMPMPSSQQQQQQQQQQFQFQGPQQQVYQPQQAYQSQQTYQQHQAPRHDKASIMALYGQSAKPQLPGQTQSIPENQAVNAFSIPRMATASQPLPGSNPFALGHSQAPAITGAGAASANVPMATALAANPTTAGTDGYNRPGRQITRDSITLGLDMAWTNGRHSPDAFASLSARHV